MDEESERRGGRFAPDAVHLWLGLGAVFLVGAVLRVWFAAITDVPIADAWRHMALVRNLREGQGFTLFANQPYVWYSPAWYRLAAALAEPEGLKWVAAAISALCAPVFTLYLYRQERGDATIALIGGLLMAAFGPMVAFCGQLGAEAFAMLLLVTALAVTACSNRSWTDWIAGGLFGLSVASRLQFAADLFLFWPVLRKRRRLGVFVSGLAIPLAAHWWRNHRVIESFPFIFTWDGLATDAARYNLLSTLAVQLHPDVIAATRSLYREILPLPEWLVIYDRYRWEIVLFVVVAFACIIASRRAGVIVAALTTVIGLTVFDQTLSSRFARIWLGFVPVVMIAIALGTVRLFRAGQRWQGAAASALFLVVLATGVPDLRPEPMSSLSEFTLPPEALSETHYMVNSGFFHPEALIYRYPAIHFIGMPLDPGLFDLFRQTYPEYRSIIWHRINVQAALFEHLKRYGGYTDVREAQSELGYPYLIARYRDAEPTYGPP